MPRSDVSELLGWLDRHGFIVEDTKTHYKVTHSTVPGQSSVPCSPSDFRWLLNKRAEIRQSFPGLDPAVWQDFPGRRSQTASTAHDQCTGTRIVPLLERLVGARGDHDFAGALTLETSGGKPRLTIGNPFYTQGSDDPLRSEPFIVIPLELGNRRLGEVAKETLSELGVNLDLQTWDEVQRAYLDFARSQRTLGIAEHEAWKAQQRNVGDEYVGRATGRQVPSLPEGACVREL